jgi:hypothetical protein
MTPDEMASLRKAARKSAGRSSDPEIVSFSDGREAAAYHAEPAAPPAAIDQTVSNGDVLLSSTLRREVALADAKPQVVAEVAEEARESSRRLEETVRAPSSSVPVRASRLWIPIALVVVSAVVLVSTVALVADRSSGPVPAASSATTDRPAPAVVATVAPPVAPSAAPTESTASAAPSASMAPSPSPPPPERPHRGNRRPSTPPASSKGSDGMIVPPL